MPEYLRAVSEIIIINKTVKKIYILILLYFESNFPENIKKQEISAITGIYIGLKKRFVNSCFTSSKDLFYNFARAYLFY